jgi:broad specificity phosphatase PhoE
VLILVRHGRTEANAAGLLLGRTDPPLDDVGRREARSLVPVLGHVELVVCSPLQRARETAAIACPGREPAIDDRWVEIDYGDLDGQPFIGLGTEFWGRWREDPGFVPGGGESLLDVGARVRKACIDLADQARSGDVVVVSHVSPIKAAVAWALDVSDELAWRLYLAPGSVTRIDVRPTGPVLHSYNETSWDPAAPRLA